MSGNAAGAVDLSLTLFGGLDTSLKATDLPEGLSPANNDVIFGPGFVASRPCASKVFANPFTNSPRVVSEHLYLQANQQPLNTYLDVLGVLRQEDVINSPGTTSQIGKVVPGSIMKAVTFDGVDYQMFSDGNHGIDIPRRYDGTFWDRLTQDGPATAPAAADLNSSIAITSITGAAQLAISEITQNGALINVITTTAHGLNTGDPVYVGVGAASGYNGSYFVQSVPSPTSFTVNGTTTGLAAAAVGYVQPNLATVICATPHGLQLSGDTVVITGNASNFYNNGQPNTSVAPASQAFQTNAGWLASSLTPTTFAIAVNVGDPGVKLGGNAQIGGLISQGTHQVCQAFLLRSGDITHPSPPVTWRCGGNKQAVISSLAIGPSNVVARILFFTGAFGALFYWVPLNVTGGAIATVVPDNTSLTATVDFADNTLFAADGISIPGNNLFNLVTLAPCLGVDAYASRLFVWGEFNKVQNFQNTGFEGGTATVGGTNPLGWTVPGAGGALVASPVDFGLAWQITGDGTGNPRGQITQTAYQNYLNQFILDPSTPYTFYWWAKASAAGLAGNLIATLSSASTGFTSTATIAIANIPNAQGQFVSANFTLQTPAVLPSDLLLTIGATGLPVGATVTIDEMMSIFTEQPYRDTVMRGSYVNNPGAFDGLTGDIGPEGDPSPIKNTFQLLEQLSILTSTGLGRRHVTRDNGGEPGTWTVDQVEEKGGAASVHCATTGPNWAMWISDTGKSLALRITAGGESFKISREMKQDFSAVNMSAKQTVWITNVDDDSRVYIGLPQGNNASPNVMAVLDYFESDTAQDIAGNRPLKIGFTGKMLTTDLGRKWTIWNLPMSCGAVLARPNGIYQFTVGSGPLNGVNFGNVYTFDATKLTDDDYGGMLPSYTTYFMVNHEMEMQLQLGVKRKYYSALTIFITGVGKLQIQALANTLTNAVKNIVDPGKPWVLTQNLADDIEFTGLDVTARRCAFKVSVAPAAGTTDVQFVISHMGAAIQKHPVSPQAGSSRGSA